MFPIALILAVLVFITVGILISAISILNIYHRHKKRRSPFTNKFLRGPGQSLIEKLDDINDELFSYLAMMIAMPIMLYAFYISDLYYKNRPLSLNLALVYIVAGVLIIGFLIFKMVRLLNLRRITRLGYEGEVATGQELNQMMLQGYHVYHDFVADKFNIDHIVVGPAGVYAVETKARSKPTSGNRSTDYKVTYDDKCIQFPNWKEFKPLEQARNQATWLERWLSSATGEKTLVRPVVALPGWFTTRMSSNGIPVINPKRFTEIA
ncbi:MAG: nuclease-related domain-containing protein [Desulfobacterales bacterium]|nr:nuclease-related domain-containing protein [Desulfobacterales bacterium]